MALSPLSPFFGFERDPFAVMRRLQDDVDRAVTWPARARGGFPAVNMWQGTDSAALTAELPGVLPSDIDITVKEDVITITGERKAPATDDQTVWTRRERGYGRFSRMIQLPFKVDPDRVEARLQDGVLQVELHRPEADKPRRVQINA